MLEQCLRCFRGSSTKQNHFLLKYDHKMSIKRCFFGPEKTLKRGNVPLFCLISGADPVF